MIPKVLFRLLAYWICRILLLCSCLAIYNISVFLVVNETNTPCRTLMGSVRLRGRDLLGLFDTN